MNAVQAPLTEDDASPTRSASISTLLVGYRTEFLATVVASSLLRGAGGIVHPLLVKSIFDQAVQHGNFSRFLVLAIAYLVFGLSVNALGTVTSLWSASLENRIARSTCRRLLDAFYEKPYVAVLRNGPGYFLTRVYSDIQEGLIPYLQAVQETTCQVVLFISMTFMLFYLSWQATVILAALVPIAALASRILGKKIETLTTQEREQEGVVVAFLSKALHAQRIVAGFGFAPLMSQAFDRRYREFLSTSFRNYRVARVFEALNSASMNISDSLSMFVGASLVIKGTISFGTYLAFVNTFWRNVTTLMQIMGSTTTLSRLGTIARRVAVFAEAASPAARSSADRTHADRVSFSYDKAPIFEDLSLHINPGEKILIVGENGSGKTTFANMLAGHLTPSVGTIALPEKISAITLPLHFPPLRVRDLVSEPSLLALFDLAGEADSLADELSSGQQQKIALALALSRDADLYLIDEPLANLDPAARMNAIRVLFERTKGKALVVIMHGFEEYHPLFDRVLDIAALNGSRVLEPLVSHA